MANGASRNSTLVPAALLRTLLTVRTLVERIRLAVFQHRRGQIALELRQIVYVAAWVHV